MTSSRHNLVAGIIHHLPYLVVSSLQWHHNEHDGFSNHSVLIVYSTVCSGTDQRNHQNSSSLAFVRGIHRWLRHHDIAFSDNMAITRNNSHNIRSDSRLAPHQWETSLQSNDFSHRLGANLESAWNIITDMIMLTVMWPVSRIYLYIQYIPRTITEILVL